MRNSIHSVGFSAWRHLAVSMAALGVIWGDIGTSPLYTVSSILCDSSLSNCATPTIDNILPLLSMIFYFLVICTSIKYIGVLCTWCDFKHEGGIFALLLKILHERKRTLSKKAVTVFTVVAAIGCSAIIADGFLTPALSVLTAVQGLNDTRLIPDDTTRAGIATAVVPITVAILLGLYAMQALGSSTVGRFYGPIVIIYMATLLGNGLYNIASTGHWAILGAVSPHYALRYFYAADYSPYAGLSSNSEFLFKALSSILLSITGAEATFADMGHFTVRAVYHTWFFVVFPCVFIAYAGQCAALIDNPSLTTNAYYGSVPNPVYVLTLIVSILATVIASQAMISGAFSLINQAVCLNLFPRVKTINTDKHCSGQIYIPEVNIMLCIGTIVLVAVFRQGSALADAYGVAVSLTFLMSSILLFGVLRNVFLHDKHWIWSALLVTPFAIFDGALLSSCLAYKIPTGGWIPLAVAVVFSSVMLVYRDVSQRIAEHGFVDLVKGASHRRKRAAASGTQKRGEGMFPDSDVEEQNLSDQIPSSSEQGQNSSEQGQNSSDPGQNSSDPGQNSGDSSQVGVSNNTELNVFDQGHARFAQTVPSGQNAPLGQDAPPINRLSMNGLAVHSDQVKCLADLAFALSTKAVARSSNIGVFLVTGFMRTISELDSGGVELHDCTDLVMEDNIPPALALYLRITNSVPRVTILLSVKFTTDAPYVPPNARVTMKAVDRSFCVYAVTVTFGYAEPLSEVDMNSIVTRGILRNVSRGALFDELFDPNYRSGPSFDQKDVWYFVHEYELRARKDRFLKKALLRLFSVIRFLGRPVDTFFNLPRSQVVRLSNALEL